MMIIELLNEAYTLLANTHPLGLDAAKHGKAMENIQTVANALEESHRKQVAQREEMARREAEREKQEAEARLGSQATSQTDPNVTVSATNAKEDEAHGD